MAATLRARWKLVLSVAVVAVAAGAVILALTAFDSSGSETAASDTEQAMLDFAQCMRDNGVPSFPDPVARPDGSFGFERPRGVPDTVLEGALASCQSELQAIGGGSGSGQDDTDVQDGLLKLSRCMRENGIPEFPDPKPGSDLISGLHGLFSDFDLESPRVARALERCQAVLNQILSPLHGGGG
jgi:hypothetical protein